MKVYADTSVLVAWFHPADRFAPRVVEWNTHQGVDFSWNAPLRMELRHHLRRLTGNYATIAWQSYRAAEASRRLNFDALRFGDVLEAADELSARHARQANAGAWDFFHVAAALRAGVKTFITCDAAQARLAKLSGISNIHLFV
jgi:predicted nucleic acid-binding protein